MKSVQVKLQSSRLDMHFRESLLELTSVCRPQLKPGGKLSYKAQHERDKWPLRLLYSLCLSFITPAEERQLIELKGRLKYFSYSCNLEAGWVLFRIGVPEKWCHWNTWKGPCLENCHDVGTVRPSVNGSVFLQNAKLWLLFGCTRIAFVFPKMKQYENSFQSVKIWKTPLSPSPCRQKKTQRFENRHAH